MAFNRGIREQGELSQEIEELGNKGSYPRKYNLSFNKKGLSSNKRHLSPDKRLVL